MSAEQKKADLVERLNKLAGPVRLNNGCIADLAFEAAAELTRLRSLNAELVEALAEYVVLGAGRCTISKTHADKALSTLTRATGGR